MLLVRARAHELDWRRWTDGAIAALGTAALGAAFVFDFVAERTTGSSLEVATSLAYPLGDIAMLAMIVGVVALTDWRPGVTWSLLLVGLAFQVIADIAYTLQATGGVVPSGNWIDPFYLLSAVFLGGILWAPSAARIRISERSDRWRELVVPLLFAAVMAGLVAMQLFGAASNLSVLLWTATMVAVIVRLAMGARENRRLLEQVRDRCADRPRQSRRHAGRPRRRSSPTQLAPGGALHVRPQRLQALQRHLRPPGRRRAAGTARHATASRRSARTGAPTGSAATSSAPCSPAPRIASTRSPSGPRKR